jgi:hypothetical protein
MKLFNNNPASTFKNIKQFVTYFQGDNRLGASIQQVNDVITNFNSILSYRVYDLLISIPGPVFQPENFRLLATGGNNETGCTVSCNPNYQTCCAGQSKEDVGFVMDSVVYIGVGVYDFTFKANAKVYPTGIDHIGFSFTPFSDIAHQVAVERIISGGTVDPLIATYRVKTFNAAVPADNILNKTIMATKTYFIGVN